MLTPSDAVDLHPTLQDHGFSLLQTPRTSSHTLSRFLLFFHLARHSQRENTHSHMRGIDPLQPRRWLQLLESDLLRSLPFSQDSNSNGALLLHLLLEMKPLQKKAFRTKRSVAQTHGDTGLHVPCALATRNGCDVAIRVAQQTLLMLVRGERLREWHQWCTRDVKRPFMGLVWQRRELQG